LECPEERDYYPYWVPNPWRDVAYLTDRVADFTDMITSNSMNLNTNFKYKCKEQNLADYTNTAVVQALTQADCTSAGGQWKAYTHGMDPTDPLNQVIVQEMPWTRDNHLGNGREGVPVNFNWTLPSVAGLVATGNVAAFGTNSNYIKCVFRLRYNLTTDDYDPWNTTSDSNQNQGAGIQSPVTQNPTVDVGAQDLQGLALAINTNQFGRTFQDRSHVFYIKKRPVVLGSNTVWNLNVRGKRGNIVETYPAVEYDFMPNILDVSLSAGDIIHIQWTGSNTHNNGDPGGDGQTGDAGEGTEGTDRHTWLQSGNSDSNYPLPLDKYTAESLLLGTNSDCYDVNGADIRLRGTETFPGVNCALALATSGQYLTVASTVNADFSPTLDESPASLIGGVILVPHKTGTFNYIDTRNNNFSNRAQKGAINVLA